MVGVLTGKSCLQDNKICEHGLYGRRSMHVAIGRTRYDSTENFSIHRESTLDQRNKARVHGGNQGQGYHDSMSRRGDQLCQMLQRRQKDDGAGVHCVQQGGRHGGMGNLAGVLLGDFWELCPSSIG